MTNKFRVFIIIPTYNEAGNVKKTTQALGKVFLQLDSLYEPHILYVDDKSPDGTGSVVRDLIKKHRYIHLLTNNQKKGLGHAYKKGMRYAIDHYKADILFEFDADLQHDPTRIPAMLKAVHDGADLVLASRYIKGGGIPKTWGIHRKFLSVIGNLFIRFVMLNFGIHDWTTGYRALSAKLANQIIPLLRHHAFEGYTWQIGFLVKTIQKGYTVREIPFVFRDRSSGHSKLGPEYIINTMRYIMKVRINQILSSRIFKFVVVGAVGAAVQFSALSLYRRIMPFQLAFFLSIETAIVSNFILSNVWTFADRKLKAKQIPAKFLTFNLSSAGSIIIQQIIAFVGENFIGLYPLATFALLGFSLTIDTGIMFAVTGIIIGMFWNFFAYSKIVWRRPEHVEGKKK